MEAAVCSEQDRVVGHRKGSGIGDNLACVEWAHWEVMGSARRAGKKCDGGGGGKVVRW